MVEKGVLQKGIADKHEGAVSDVIDVVMQNINTNLTRLNMQTREIVEMYY